MTERYEPPQARLRDDRSDLSQGSIDVMECVRVAWEDTWRNFPLWLGVWVVGAVVMVASAVTIIGAFLVGPILFYGGVLFYLNMTDRRASFSDLFAGFQSYLAVLVSGLILVFLLALIGQVGSSVQYVGEAIESPLLIAVGYLVSLAWTFLVVLRVYFAAMLWVDREYGPVEAIQASWDLTRGRTGSLIGLMVAGVVVIVLGVLAFLIGVFPAMNMTYLMWTTAYRQLVPEAPAREAEHDFATAAPRA